MSSSNNKDEQEPAQQVSETQEKLDSIIQSFIQLTALANKVPFIETEQDADLTKVKSADQIDDDQNQKQVKKRAQKVLTQLYSLISYVQPEKISQISKLKQKNQNTIISDLAGSHLQSQHYEDLVVNVCDDLIENVNKQIDLIKQERENPEKQQNFQNTNQPIVRSEQFYQDRPQTDNTLKKSQIQWWTSIDNSYRPFVPTLASKPNSKYPLSEDIVTAQRQIAANPLLNRQFQLGDHKQQKDAVSLSHPYYQEIEEFQEEVGNMQTLQEEIVPQKYKALEDTPFEFVDDEEKLDEMVKILSGSREIAIDLEHHNHRSYQGFTCLMQISNRTHDYVVDTLKLRQSLGPKLLPLFTDPQITKVLHGADYDVEWLQKDFSLYVVNMFDTGQAARILQKPGFGLAFLLQSYCGVLTDKKYQLADWRQRPIPEEMLKYAREDTHYLLYVYDLMRKELIQNAVKQNASNPLSMYRQVLIKSNQLCQKQYEKPIVKDYNYYMIVGRNKTIQSMKQISVLKMLVKLRDYIARLEDESSQYAIPNHIMFQMGKDLPTTRNQIKDCCRSNITGIILKYQDLIIQEINKKINNPKNNSKHIKFDDKPKDPIIIDSSKLANQNLSSKDTPMSEVQQDNQQKSENQQFTLDNVKFPEFKIKMNLDTAKSMIFDTHSTQSNSPQHKQSKKKSEDAKILQQNNNSLSKASVKSKEKAEQKLNKLQKQMSNLTSVDVFKLMTGNQEMKVTLNAKSNASEIQENAHRRVVISNDVDQNDLKNLLGKRKDHESDNIQESKLKNTAIEEDENPVVSVTQEDFIPANDKKSKKQRRDSQNDKRELPMSIKEKYGLQQTSSKNKDKESKSQEKSSNKEQNPKVVQAEAKSDSQTKTTQQDWSQIYGKAAPQINSILDKHAKMIVEKTDPNAKKKKKEDRNMKPMKSESVLAQANNKGSSQGNTGKKDKVPKYYLGAMFGDLKGTNFKK
eukprot:403344491